MSRSDRWRDREVVTRQREDAVEAAVGVGFTVYETSARDGVCVLR